MQTLNVNPEMNTTTARHLQANETSQHIVTHYDETHFHAHQRNY